MQNGEFSGRAEISINLVMPLATLLISLETALRKVAPWFGMS